MSVILEARPETNNVKHSRNASQPAKPRKLVQNLTSSYLLGGAPDAMNTSHLQMLVNQQKAMNNFKQINTWVSDLEERLDDLRDTVNRRISDMAIGMQRRNMLIAHYNYMGEATGTTLGSVGGMNPLSSN
jgi:hypothetical protein